MQGRLRTIALPSKPVAVAVALPAMAFAIPAMV